MDSIEPRTKLSHASQVILILKLVFMLILHPAALPLTSPARSRVSSLT